MSSVDADNISVNEIKSVLCEPEEMERNVDMDQSLQDMNIDKSTAENTTSPSVTTEQMVEIVKVGGAHVELEPHEEPTNIDSREQNWDGSEVKSCHVNTEVSDVVCTNLDTALTPAHTIISDEDNVKIIQNEETQMPVKVEDSEINLAAVDTAGNAEVVTENTKLICAADVEIKDEPNCDSNSPQPAKNHTDVANDDPPMETSEQETGDGCTQDGEANKIITDEDNVKITQNEYAEMLVKVEYSEINLAAVDTAGKAEVVTGNTKIICAAEFEVKDEPNCDSNSPEPAKNHTDVPNDNPPMETSEQESGDGCTKDGEAYTIITSDEDNVKITQNEDAERPVKVEDSEINLAALNTAEKAEVVTGEKTAMICAADVEAKDEPNFDSNIPEPAKKTAKNHTNVANDNPPMETSEQETGDGCTKVGDDSMSAAAGINEGSAVVEDSDTDRAAEAGRQVILEIIDDRITRPRKPAAGYRMADDSYDSDSSDSVSSDDSSICISSDSELAVEVPEEEKGTKTKASKKKGPKKDVFEVDIRTKGELTFEELPTLDELKIDVDPKVVLMEVGAVSSILGPIVIVQANKLVPALDEDTILFSEDRKPIGQVFETFGPVPAPLYIVRFNTVDDIVSRGVVVGNKVFYAPSMKEYTRFIFVEQLKQLRGSDASWEHNNEPPEKHLDYSDDEQEREARHKSRSHENGDGEDDTPENDKKRQKRKPRQQNAISEGRSHQNRAPHKRHHQKMDDFAWPPRERTLWTPPPPPRGAIPQWPPTPPPGGVGYPQGLPPSRSPAPGPWGMMTGPHLAAPNQSPLGSPQPSRARRHTGGFGTSRPNPGTFKNGGPPCSNSFGAGGRWLNQGRFNTGPLVSNSFNSSPPSSNQWPPNTSGPPPSTQQKLNGTNSWPPNSNPGRFDTGFQRGPVQLQGPSPPPQRGPLQPMDMRYVQNEGGAPNGVGPCAPRMPPPYPTWNTGPTGPMGPTHIHIRPTQFGGPPNFSTWGPG